MEEKQKAAAGPRRSLGGLHHSHIVRFCGVVFRPPHRVRPQSGLHAALHGILCHLVEAGGRQEEGEVVWEGKEE